jgi:nucleotide-binding universal stress UspA family protein
MLTVNRILLPTDFSPASIAAAEYADAFANSFGSVIHVVHVLERRVPLMIPHGPVGEAREFTEAAREVATIATEEFCRNHISPGLFRAEAIICQASIVSTLAEYADTHDIDLIVVSSGVTRLLQRVLHGSIGESLAECAPCPVLIVPHPPASP